MDNNIPDQVDNIDRQCDIILEQLRFEYIEPLQALEQLKDMYAKLE